MSVDLGIPDDQRKDIVAGLSRLLADTYTLYLKTHNFHWNVTGPQFNDLHAMFMVQYTELWTAVDLVAERIRALGAYAPGGYHAFSSLTSLEEPESVPAAQEMVRMLMRDHEAVARTARSILGPIDAGRDEVSHDLVVQRLQIHEKTAWMLRSLLA